VLAAGARQGSNAMSLEFCEALTARFAAGVVGAPPGGADRDRAHIFRWRRSPAPSPRAGRLLYPQIPAGASHHAGPRSSPTRAPVVAAINGHAIAGGLRARLRRRPAADGARDGGPYRRDRASSSGSRSPPVAMGDHAFAPLRHKFFAEAIFQRRGPFAPLEALARGLGA